MITFILASILYGFIMMMRFVLLWMSDGKILVNLAVALLWPLTFFIGGVANVLYVDN